MVQLRKKRTAFLLYSVLLVLPTAVLGGLQWRQLVRDHQQELDAVPEQANDAARRLVDSLRERLDQLVGEENRRPFFHYGSVYSAQTAVADDLVILPSPLLQEVRGPGLLAWFNYEPYFAWRDRSEGRDPKLDVYWGPDTLVSEGGPSELDLRMAAYTHLERSVEEGMLVRATRIQDLSDPVAMPLSVVAVNRAEDPNNACLQGCLGALEHVTMPVTMSGFHLQIYRDDLDAVRVVATRRAFCLDELPPLVPEADCIRAPLEEGFALIQGFFIDPRWLFTDLPRSVAARVLDSSVRLVTAEEDDPPGPDEHRVEIDLVKALDLRVDSVESHPGARVSVALDKGVVDRRFRSQAVRFLVVSAMLVLSLATGMLLLVRTVSRELEQATRTENFVSAVTHELRTPLSSIRLHAEMLLEGWADDPEKREVYYRRIMRETDRLSTLVERVLQKGEISQGTTKTEPADLSALVERMAGDLQRVGLEDGRQVQQELVFELAEDLPQVRLTQEALAGILVNLVENARKYGTSDRGGSIVVRTRLESGRVVLEVADRGPGIPAEERERVFEAFYRMGNEATRTSTGTGLGLHLVAVHADSLGGRVRVLENPGGGALFRIEFVSA